MTTVRRSLALSALDNHFALALQLISTVVLARILTPAETGIFAVAAVFAALASTFRDFGVAEYLIQEQEVDAATIRSALTVNIAVSWLMSATLFALAPLAAEFYRADGVSNVMRVQAISFLLIPFGAVTMAWFRRELNFRPIVIAGLLANSISFVVSISLALLGFGYMALAWSSLAGVVVTVAVSLWMRPAWFPRWPGVGKVGRVLHFGKFASGIYIFGQVGRGAPEMVIGRAQDMAAVGLFSRAYGLVEIFNRLVLKAVMPVCLPYFASSARETGSPLRGYLHAISLLTGIGWSFLACMAVGAYPAVRLMYGVQWLESIPLARILCMAAAVELLYYPAKEALLAIGKARESNQLQIITTALRVGGLMLAVPWGLAGASFGLLAAAAASAVITHIYLGRHIGLTVAAVLRATASSLYVALFAVAPLAIWVASVGIGEGNYLLAAAAGGTGACVAWLLGLRASRHLLCPELARVAGSIRRRMSGRA